MLSRTKICKNNLSRTTFCKTDPYQFGKFVKKKVCLELPLTRFAKQFCPKKAFASVRKVNMKKLQKLTVLLTIFAIYNIINSCCKGRVALPNQMNFWKGVRGRGVIFNPNIYVADFGKLKQGLMSKKLIKSRNLRVQGMFFSTIVFRGKVMSQEANKL